MNEQELRRLIKLMGENDHKAFEEFFNILYPRFYRYAFLFLKSDVLCEEVVSDVFLKLWNARAKLIDVSQLEFYLFRAMKNQVLTYLRRNSIAKIELTEYPQSDLVEYNQPERQLLNKELSKTIQSAISKLPDKCQVIFRMVKEDGLSYQQVSELLNLSIKTVENQMNIAFKRLRVLLEQYYDQDRSSTRFMLLFLI